MLSGEGSYSAVDMERLQSSSGSSLLLGIYKKTPCCSEHMHETSLVFRVRNLNLIHLPSAEDILAATSVVLCCILCCWSCTVGRLLWDEDRLGCCINMLLPWNEEIMSGALFQ